VPYRWRRCTEGLTGCQRHVVLPRSYRYKGCGIDTPVRVVVRCSMRLIALCLLVMACDPDKTEMSGGPSGPLVPSRPLPQLWVCQCGESCMDAAVSLPLDIQQVVCASPETAEDQAARYCGLRSSCGLCSCSCTGPYACE